MAECYICSGKGNSKCEKCNGSGKIRNSSYILVLSEITNLANDWTKCYKCNGTGKKTCYKCGGSGYYNDD